MNDIYAAPQSELRDATPQGAIGGNVEDAIAGNIEISMIGTLGEAWDQMKGFKTKCHVAFLLYFLIYMLVIAVVFAVSFGLTIAVDELTGSIFGQLFGQLAGALMYPVLVGISILGIRHALNAPTSSTMVLRHFNKMLPLLLCYLLTIVLVMFGFVLLVLPGIYLLVAYWYANLLLVEKDMGIWQAMETSRKALTKKWFPFFGLLMLLWLINMLGLFTLTISWIWTLPWSVLTLSTVYIKLFGAEAQTLAD